MLRRKVVEPRVESCISQIPVFWLDVLFRLSIVSEALLELGDRLYMCELPILLGQATMSSLSSHKCAVHRPLQPIYEEGAEAYGAAC